MIFSEKITEKRNNRDFFRKKPEISRLFLGYFQIENNREITEKQNNRDFLTKNNRFLG
jgi:hypothetical protein